MFSICSIGSPQAKSFPRVLAVEGAKEIGQRIRELKPQQVGEGGWREAAEWGQEVDLHGGSPGDLNVGVHLPNRYFELI